MPGVSTYDAVQICGATSSTITAKGQTTVPQQVRELIGAGPGTRLVWHVMPDGGLIVRAKTHSVLDLAGSLKAPKGKRVKVEDMNAWRLEPPGMAALDTNVLVRFLVQEDEA